jgi:hypothetical protein
MSYRGKVWTILIPVVAALDAGVALLVAQMVGYAGLALLGLRRRGQRVDGGVAK